MVYAFVCRCFADVTRAGEFVVVTTLMSGPSFAHMQVRGECHVFHNLLLGKLICFCQLHFNGLDAN